MSLPHALMVSLIEKSCSGYDLAQRFGKSIGFFWPASHQQIYRELAKMEAKGWVKSEAEEGSKTRKRIYHVLDDGVQELKRWVTESVDPIQLREEFVVRLRADAAIGPLGLETELSRRAQIHQQKLETYQAIEKRDFLDKIKKDPSKNTRELKIQHLILKTGIAYEENWLQWCKDVGELLKEDS
ncbi:MAG: PadR family transcriptional regulator [Gammaproteobacteria bacterium]|nr:PadR family transcriptional regulator [Gammaproteobacteria bacterium]